jgi:AcrR family transcriptional regulator
MAAELPIDVNDVRRDAILSAAATLFAERGFRSVSMADVGAAAGMSAASLYRFFAGKGEILAAMWDRALTDVADAAAQVAAAPGSPEQRLEGILRAHAELLVTKYADVGNLVRRGTIGLPQAQREALQTKETAYLALWSDQLEPLLGAGGDEIVTRIFAGLAILHSVATSNPRHPDETLIEQLVAMAKAGMVATVVSQDADDG